MFTINDLLTLPVAWLLTGVSAAGITYCRGTVDENLKDLKLFFFFFSQRSCNKIITEGIHLNNCTVSFCTVKVFLFTNVNILTMNRL